MLAIIQIIALLMHVIHNNNSFTDACITLHTLIFCRVSMIHLVTEDGHPSAIPPSMNDSTMPIQKYGYNHYHVHHINE